MAKQLKSEIEVLDQIGAKNFRSIKKEQIIEFASSIHQMPKEVAIKCIEQFPEFRKNANEVLTTLKEIFKDVSNSNKDLASEEIAACNKILDHLGEELHKPFISAKRKEHIIKQMVEVAHIIDNARESHTNLMHKIAHCATLLGLAVIGVAGAIVGVNVKKR